MALTEAQLKALLDKSQVRNVGAYLVPLNAALSEFQISGSLLQTQYFLAQILHETNGCKWFVELWGPTEEQRHYEPPFPKAAELGNTQKGDGYRYRGRGAFQVTGRGNYRRYGEKLGLPLEAQPELAAGPHAAFRIAGAYWQDHHLGVLADAGDFEGVTRGINGGVNGLAERKAWLKRVQAVVK